MYWINVYKTSRSAGGLLVNSYYADIPQMTQPEFWNWAFHVKQFDASFTATDTHYLAITGTPTTQGNKWPGTSARLWAPALGMITGVIPVSEPLPWRWTLGVSLYTGTPVYGKHHYHDAISKEQLDWDSLGNVVLGLNPGGAKMDGSELMRIGGNYEEWLRVGIGNATPGQAFEFLEVIQALPSGVPVLNKARRAQARIFNQAIAHQTRVVMLMVSAGAAFTELSILHSENTGHWIREALRPTTTNIMGTVIGMLQAFKDNDEGENGQTINQGSGWNSRFGPTSAEITGQLEKFKKKMEEDLKWLQKFPPFADVSGDLWFGNGEAQEWFTVADDWSQYLGFPGGFDFLNPDQEGLKDMSRLDNYTPNYPDLPYKVLGLPRPTKNPKRKVEPFGLIV